MRRIGKESFARRFAGHINFMIYLGLYLIFGCDLRETLEPVNRANLLGSPRVCVKAKRDYNIQNTASAREFKQLFKNVD